MTSSAVTVRMSDTAEAIRSAGGDVGHRARQRHPDSRWQPREAERAGGVGGHRVDVLHAVERGHEQLPEGWRTRPGRPCLKPGAVDQDGQRDQRHRRDGAQELDHRPRGAVEQRLLEPIRMPSGMASTAAMPSPSAQPWSVSCRRPPRSSPPGAGSPSRPSVSLMRREVVARQHPDAGKHLEQRQHPEHARPGQRPVGQRAAAGRARPRAVRSGAAVTSCADQLVQVGLLLDQAVLLAELGQPARSSASLRSARQIGSLIFSAASGGISV